MTHGWCTCVERTLAKYMQTSRCVAIINTLECYTFPPVFSSSGQHNDGVVCVTLEVSESDLSCCWVTELQGGLTTSLRTVGHTGGVEAVWSWA